MDDILDLLDDTAEQLALVQRIYDECAKTGEMSRRLKPRIKNVLENQRSLLDYLAHNLHERYGTPVQHKIYYPFASEPAKFVNEIDGRMPGVRKARPDIAEAIKRHQPYEHDWMVWLTDLRNESGHRILSKHTPYESRRTDFQLPGGGMAHVQDVTVIGPDGKPGHPSMVFGGHTGYTDVALTGWTFTQPPMPVPIVLQLIDAGLRAAIVEIAQAADL